MWSQLARGQIAVVERVPDTCVSMNTMDLYGVSWETIWMGDPQAITLALPFPCQAMDIELPLARSLVTAMATVRARHQFFTLTPGSGSQVATPYWVTRATTWAGQLRCQRTHGYW